MLDQPAPGRSVGIAVAFKREHLNHMCCQDLVNTCIASGPAGPRGDELGAACWEGCQTTANRPRCACK